MSDTVSRTNQPRFRATRVASRYQVRQALVFIAALAAISMGLSQLRASAAESSVVAVVNADPISRDALGDAVLQRYGTDVLDNLVNQHLIMQECKKNGIDISAEDVRTEVLRVAKKFGLSLESYLQLLQEERDITPDQYSREIIWPMLALRALVSDQVEVTQEEFNRAFLSQFGEAIKCRMIMVSDPTQANQLQSQAQVDPGSFVRLAKEFSEDETSASVGGLIPPIRRYMGDSNLEEAAFALKDGEVSPVLQIGDQWIFLQAVRRMPASHPSPQALPAIKEQIADRIRDEKMKVAAGELFEKLQKESKVVKVLGNPEASQQHPGVAAIINGQQISIAAVADKCIKRHGEEVLEGEINRKLLAQALKSSGKTVTQADIDQEITRAAISYGYIRSDGKADTDAWMQTIVSQGKSTEKIYVQDAVWPSVALKKLVEDSVQLSQDDMQKGFASAFGPRAEVLAIVLSDQRTAQKVWEMARDNASEDFFGQLAEQYSIEPTSSSNFGKVPPIRQFGGQPAIEKEAFAMKPGELSGIIATGDKYIVLRCQGFTEPIVSDFEAVREELERDLIEKKTNLAMGVKFDELKQRAEIDNFFSVSKAAPRVATRSGGR
ncbi:Parvulin-like peptidyl-prolyl isomerase [Neorhodopirellula lusitana]|uniref:peptidylprolyl isomerase n=1 Tax=Neorhodopirellula lusitana TaxID=445327 RepID=A0ABY1PPS7_9BACT|nr:peptidylprolyl isomerase [Neorhodopirellula lusitana]SMP41348.1 Parvulin-like peptidyl-prolyl isomerase [Neorhodopirellula lusitana]